MRALTFSLILLLPASAWCAVPTASHIQAIAAESQPAAKASLSAFNKLVTADNAAPMGFKESSDVARAQLDTPLSDFMVRLDVLGKYTSRKDPMTLLDATDTVVYPVKVDDVVQSSVTLQKHSTEWRPVAFGAPRLATALHATRDTVVKRDRRASGDFFQVRVPALNLVFLGHVVNGKLMLTSVTDADSFGIKQGVTRPASEVFAGLSAEARSHNGLPR